MPHRAESMFSLSTDSSIILKIITFYGNKEHLNEGFKVKNVAVGGKYVTSWENSKEEY